MVSVLLLSILGCNQEGAPPPIAHRGEDGHGGEHRDHGAEGVAERGPDHEPEIRVAGEPQVPASGPAEPVEVADILLSPPRSHSPAPATYQIEMETTQGTFSLTCHRDWAPNGADRLYFLVDNGYYTDIAFFRVVRGFMAQFGMHGSPKVLDVYKDDSHAIPDDPSGVQSNTRGRLSFATAGPNTRTSQLFISFGDNSNLDPMGFAPVCEVDDGGMKVVDSLYNGYGEGAPRGAGPRQDFIIKRGNEYLRTSFPKLDYIVKARIKK
jgi:peptidyl-prolyl cis-trans isomerase A (cyclophilin A)